MLNRPRDGATRHTTQAEQKKKSWVNVCVSVKTRLFQRFCVFLRQLHPMRMHFTVYRAVSRPLVA